MKTTLNGNCSSLSNGGFVTLTSSTGRGANYYNASDVLKTTQSY